jgi:shikimate kinase
MTLGRPVVWLRAHPDLLASRLEGDGTRPLLEGDTPAGARLGEILERRKQVYASLATDIVDTDGRAIERVVDDVIGIWGT